MPTRAATGVALRWLVTPDLRRHEACAGGRWLPLPGSFADSNAVRVAPFDAIALDLSLRWA